ncbi:restriction endonuclease subunit S [Staphylococcus epidermidis]|nr:restriction endonuclease subunit S [Staphylococcus epidermidis]MCG1278743.1 restriction endonuclease subunit S [Staphylococcus epidermidis]MCG1894421.1 restriction endonuclease subunit S [Staphylococcus epidermidis]MCG2085256.1 restriction endonuclease subunit S [Staphylococcus epidermidis]MCG2465084.1 restriction endonuclease subunit S [Staphylococcus epidermidis]
MNKQTNTPELRFPEFDEEWEFQELGNLAQFSKGKLLSKKDLNISGIPCILYGELYTKYGAILNKVYSKTSTQNDSLVFSKRNQILIPSSGETDIDIATATAIDTDVKIAVGGDLNIITPINSDGRFISLYINGKGKYNLAKYAQGKSVVHLYNSDIKKLNFYLPTNMAEQQKIGNFFSKLDRQIELEEEKLELLEQQKKGYMQKIFSQELRFKDENGNDYPNWENEKLEDVANYRRGSFPQPYGNKEWYDDIDGEPFVQVYDVNSNMKLNEETKQKISEKAKPKSVKGFKGDIVVTLQGSIGRVAILQYDAYIDRTLLLINSFKCPVNKGYFKYILYLLFLREKERAPGGTIKTITKSVLSNFKIQIPVLEEQEKIGTFFKKIDELIEKQSNKIEVLKENKKGFLQKMFV